MLRQITINGTANKQENGLVSFSIKNQIIAGNLIEAGQIAIHPKINDFFKLEHGKQYKLVLGIDEIRNS